MKKGLAFVVVLSVFLCQFFGSFHVQASTRVLMGSWDLNGDGKLQSVYNCGSYIQVQQPNGSFKAYSINSGNWALLAGGVTDMDGKAGCEIAINRGADIEVIHDATGTIKYYNINASTWALLAGGIADMDGKAGCEIVINRGSNIEVIHDATGSIKYYSVNALNWALLIGGISDLDGKAGCEIAINCGSSIAVIHDATGSIKYYNTSGNWYLVGIYNQDGQPGNEIIYSYFNNNKYAICDARGTQYSVN